MIGTKPLTLSGYKTMMSDILLRAFSISVSPPSAPASPGGMGESPPTLVEPQLGSRFPEEPGQEIPAFSFPSIES